MVMYTTYKLEWIGCLEYHGRCSILLLLFWIFLDRIDKNKTFCKSQKGKSFAMEMPFFIVVGKFALLVWLQIAVRTSMKYRDQVHMSCL